MSASAQYGTPFFDTSATASGRMRSNAAANTTRVEDRNTEPTQPTNHSARIVIRMNWSTGLPKNIAASVPG